MPYGYSGPRGYDMRKQFGLIEAALPSAQPVDGNRNDGIESLVTRKRGDQFRCQRPIQGADLGVLEKVDQVAQSAFVGAEGVGGVKTRSTFTT